MPQLIQGQTDGSTDFGVRMVGRIRNEASDSEEECRSGKNTRFRKRKWRHEPDFRSNTEFGI